MTETVVPIRVQPRASRNAIVCQDGGIKVYTTAPPVDGEANDAILVLIAKALGTSKSNLDLVSGGKSKSKKIAVRGFTLEQIQAKLTSDS